MCENRQVTALLRLGLQPSWVPKDQSDRLFAIKKLDPHHHLWTMIPANPHCGLEKHQPCCNAYPDLAAKYGLHAPWFGQPRSGPADPHYCLSNAHRFSLFYGLHPSWRQQMKGVASTFLHYSLNTHQRGASYR